MTAPPAQMHSRFRSPSELTADSPNDHGTRPSPAQRRAVGVVWIQKPGFRNEIGTGSLVQSEHARTVG